ncbi:MAG: 2-oxo acid dehydrogenase subunit E2 [Bacteriovoracaceae bacterium]|nr:2-oxo acid dehydrogenase subunit E2 [Bacteriovoracaceae bacterium]
MMYEFKFPDVGEGVHEGTILQIKVAVGEKVEAGDVLAVVETDKVTAEIPSSKDGVVTKFGFAEGQVIEVGQTLAYIEIEGEAGEEKPKSEAVVEENANVVGELDLGDGSILPASGEGMNDDSHENASLHTATRGQKFLATPLARKLAKNKGIDLSTIKGTGPAGRITKKDLQNFTSSEIAPSSPSTSSTEQVIEKLEGQVIPMTKLRQTIAKNMIKSSEIPTATIHEEINFDKIVEWRKQINATGGERISFLPIIVKALTLTIKKFPEFNATFDTAKQEIHRHGNINMGIAMDNGSGLYVPVIKKAESLTVGEISSAVKGYMDKVNSGTISIGDMRGGSFTISNYGVEGGLFANPLILPPQVAILGLGRIHKKPVVVNDEIVVGQVLPISLVIDHRVLDGVPAGRFISYLRNLLENPHHLMMAMV